ncbi:hypothetical protein N431DRAFT_513963 [Stipitochalara longipes BDJ]|nr:hypothetical protein N431DRAFT_513963 [Stipitochalara longipes BDJ]
MLEPAPSSHVWSNGSRLAARRGSISWSPHLLLRRAINHISLNRSHSCAPSGRPWDRLHSPVDLAVGCRGGDVRFETSLRPARRPSSRAAWCRTAQTPLPGRAFYRVWRWIWRYRLGCRMGPCQAMPPLPMERDDSLWHPGLCWTSSAAGAHLHKFVTSFWRVDRQTAAALLLCCCSTATPRIAAGLVLAVSGYSSTWPTAACPRLRIRPADWLRCCPLVPVPLSKRECKYWKVACACAACAACACCCLLLLPQ